MRMIFSTNGNHKVFVIASSDCKLKVTSILMRYSTAMRRQLLTAQIV